MSVGTLTATKKNPEQPTVPGFASLLPQLAGSFIRAATVGGWGPPGWPTRSTVTARNLSAVSPHKVAFDPKARGAIMLGFDAMDRVFAAERNFYRGAADGHLRRSPRPLLTKRPR
jgi:hypothetical protein